MDILDYLNEEEIDRTRDYINFVKTYKAVPEESIFKTLLISAPDEIAYNYVIELIRKNIKSKIIEFDANNLFKATKLKYSSRRINFLSIVDIGNIINKISLEEFKEYIKKLNEFANKKENLFIIMGFNNNVVNAEECLDMLDDIVNQQIDIKKPDPNNVKTILSKYQTRFSELKSIDLDDLAECFLGDSSAFIERVLTIVHAEVENGIINELTCKTIYRYVLRYKNKGKLNKLTEIDKKIISYHEIGHFISDYLLNNSSGIISLGGYGFDLGHYKSNHTNRNYIISLEDVRNEIIVCLSGIACTEMLLHNKYTGGNDDIQKSRVLYRRMSESAMLGLDNLPPLSEDFDDSILNKNYYIKENQFLKECLDDACKIIETNKNKIEEIYQELIKCDVLLNKELNSIMAR